MALSIASIFALVATAGQSLFLTPAGSDFITTRSHFINRVSNSQEMKESNGLFCQSMFRLGSTQLCVLRPEALKKESLTYLTSEDYEGSRNSFQPFQEMFQVSGGTPVSWIFNQNSDADAGRKHLSKYFHATREEELERLIREETDAFIDKFTTAEAGVWTSDDWYESVHQFVIRIFTRHILGLQYIPEHAAELITATEKALFEETPTFKIAGYEMRLTESQRKFARARANFVTLANELLSHPDNIKILSNPESGYLSFLLDARARETQRSIDELLHDENELAWIKTTIAGFFLGVGNFASSVTLGMAHLQSLHENTTEHVFKETVRLLSGQISRFTVNELRLNHVNGSEITLPAHSFFFIDYRGASFSEQLWADPMQFNPGRFIAEAQTIHTPEFSPFSVGRRMCPAGPVAAQKAFSLILESFYSQVRVEFEKPELLRDLVNWTTDDFVTRPREAVRGRLLKTAP